MCVSPISVNISSRIRYFNPNGLTSSFVNVPCGHCYECRTSARNGFYLRLMDEFQRNENAQGCCVFLTFTYRDDQVPVLDYEFVGDDIEFYPYRGIKGDFDLFRFEKSDLQRFFNSFRKRFERFGIDSPFRYFVVGEYGSDVLHTQRPHYHALLFLCSSVVSHYRCFDVGGVNMFLNDCNDLWHHGIVSPSKEGLVVDSLAAASYCSKYVGKGSDLSDLIRFNTFRDFLSSCVDSLTPEDFCYSPSVDSYFRYYMRKFGCRCFQMCSRGFGAGLLDHFTNDIKHENYSAVAERLIKGVPVVSESSGQTFYYNYPQYIVSRLLYVVREDGSRYLSPAGYEIKKHVQYRSYLDFVKRVSNVDLLAVRDFLFDTYGVTDGSVYFRTLLDFKKQSVLSFFDFGLYVYFCRGRYSSRTSLRILQNLLIDRSLTPFHKFDHLYRYVNGYHLSLQKDPDSYCFNCSASEYFVDHHETMDFYINYHMEQVYSILSAYFTSQKKSLADLREMEDHEAKRISDILNSNYYGI